MKQAYAMQRKIKRKATRLLIIFAFVLFPLLHFVVSEAHAVVINKPTESGINSEMKIRNGRPHKGIDYADSCGTTITLPVPASCYFQGSPPKGDGWGAYAMIDRGCGVVELYAHLNSCRNGSTTIETGGAAGTKGAGSSTGCHLHYEIRINSCHVNPESAYGQDLCQESVKTPLFNEARSILGEYATCSASGGGNQTDTGTPPTTGNVQEVTLVGVGETDPGTNIPNVGTPYYYVETLDGRIIREPVMPSYDDPTPLLPPTTENVVPTTTTANEVTGCATDTWTAMVNQAVLQTRRETVINQRYITKGDNIATYSCFNENARAVGRQLGPIFSESKQWANRQIDLRGKTLTINKELGDTSLDGAINTTAMYTYESWIRGNFDHSFLGGTLPEAPTPNGQLEDDVTHAFMPCGLMNQIWNMAKCGNISDSPMFPRFEDLITPESDPRKFPSDMSCNSTGITQAMINRAKQTGAATADTHLNILYPDSGGNCARPIRTGVTVERQRGIGRITTTVTYPDAVCPTLGCTYQRSAAGAGTCE